MTAIVTQYVDRPTWLVGRQPTCGSSDASALLGVHRDKHEYATWVDKTEPLEIRERDEWLRRAERREPWIIQEFVLASKIAAEPAPKFTIWTNPAWSLIMSCSLDGILTESGRPLECKTAQFAQGKIWKHKVPADYMIQVNTQLAILERDFGYIAVEIDGIMDFRWHRVNRNERIIRLIKQRCEEFWERYVIPRVAPPLDYSEATRKAICRLYPADDTTTVDLPDESGDWIVERDKLNVEIAKRQESVDLIDNRIRAAIGSASYGRLWDGSGFSYKANGKGTRTLRRCKKVSEPDE